MNILQINTLDNKGGAALVSYRLKQKLEKMKHTTSMFVAKKRSNDINIFLINRQNKLFNATSKLLKIITKKDILNYLKSKIRPLLINDINFFDNKNLLYSKEFKKADIIHCHNLHGNYFNLKSLQKISKTKPIVWTLHDMWAITSHYTWALSENDIQKNDCPQFDSLKKFSICHEKNYNYLLHKKEKIYKNSKLNIVVPSLWLKEKIKKSILKNQALTLIYNGVDNNIFKQYNKLQTRKKLNLPKNKKIITFLSNGGKNNNQKGWNYTQHVINYYKNNKDILFLCIGGGGNSRQLNTTNVIYIEYVNNQELLAQYYSTSDIFLFTSLFENFPLVILEAMSCGTPIVSFDVGGVKEALIHKQNGYIAKYKDVNDLLNGIKYIFGLEKSDLEKNSQNSIQRVKENFTLDIMTENYIKLYKQILSKKQNL